MLAIQKKTFWYFALLLGTYLLVSGCASTKKTTQPAPTTAPAGSGLDESFDPVALNDEDIEIPAAAGEEVTPGSIRQPTPPSAVETPSINREVDGFRVQLFASRDIEKATLEKQEAELVFARDSLAVYIEFDSPMYKVRLGDCQSREEAENLRVKARRKGYPTAWIVKTRVNSLPSLPKTSDSDLDRF